MCLLHRQIEAIAASAAAQQASHAEAERRLLERLRASEAGAAEATEAARLMKALLLGHIARCSFCGVDELCTKR